MASRRDVVQWLTTASVGFAVPLLTTMGCRREPTPLRDAISTSDDGWILAYANEPTEVLIFDLA